MTSALPQLSAVSFSDLKGWDTDDPRPLFRAMLDCLTYLRKGKLYKSGALGLTADELIQLLEKAEASGEPYNSAPLAPSSKQTVCLLQFFPMGAKRASSLHFMSRRSRSTIPRNPATNIHSIFARLISLISMRTTGLPKSIPIMLLGASVAASSIPIQTVAKSTRDILMAKGWR